MMSPQPRDILDSLPQPVWWRVCSYLVLVFSQEWVKVVLFRLLTLSYPSLSSWILLTQRLGSAFHCVWVWVCARLGFLRSQDPPINLCPGRVREGQGACHIVCLLPRSVGPAPWWPPQPEECPAAPPWPPVAAPCMFPTCPLPSPTLTCTRCSTNLERSSGKVILGALHIGALLFFLTVLLFFLFFYFVSMVFLFILPIFLFAHFCFPTFSFWGSIFSSILYYFSY